MTDKLKVTFNRNNSPIYRGYTFMDPPLETFRIYECSADIEFDSVEVRKLSRWERIKRLLLRITGRIDGPDVKPGNAKLVAGTVSIDEEMARGIQARIDKDNENCVKALETAMGNLESY